MWPSSNNTAHLDDGGAGEQFGRSTIVSGVSLTFSCVVIAALTMPEVQGRTCARHCGLGLLLVGAVLGLGNLHLCQGIVIGNIGRTPLREICSTWDPASDPVVGPLLAGGPAGLAATCGGPGADEYADACHLCYEVRRAARDRFPETLLPDQVYGG